MTDQSLCAAPPLQRAVGDARLVVRSVDGLTRLADLYQQGAAKIRFPAGEGVSFEAVLINTAGGLTGGDRLAVSVRVGDGADAVIATQACEKIYRAESGQAFVENTVSVGAGGRCDWLPQETILFDGAGLKRRLRVALAADSRFLAVEALVLGRSAFGETINTLALHDHIAISRAGRLIYADALSLSGASFEALNRRARGGGAGGMASVLYAAPDADARLDAARGYLASCRSETAASAWNGLLVMRFMAATAADLRHDLMSVMTAWRGRDMPRAWSI